MACLLALPARQLQTLFSMRFHIKSLQHFILWKMQCNFTFPESDTARTYRWLERENVSEACMEIFFWNGNSKAQCVTNLHFVSPGCFYVLHTFKWRQHVCWLKKPGYIRFDIKDGLNIWEDMTTVQIFGNGVNKMADTLSTGWNWRDPISKILNNDKRHNRIKFHACTPKCQIFFWHIAWTTPSCTQYM